MKRTWLILAVQDVPLSARWYMTLLGAGQTHPGGNVFDQIVDEDGTVLVCLHWWGPSGPHGDHHWPSLAEPGERPPGNGLLVWFLVDDFEAAWQRAHDLDVAIEEPPNADNGTGMRAFMVRDPDGYFVVVNEARP
jgi:catechol 2,3-dioxygenase-like lactoylglutathione lyase family enzyme